MLARLTCMGAMPPLARLSASIMIARMTWTPAPPQAGGLPPNSAPTANARADEIRLPAPPHQFGMYRGPGWPRQLPRERTIQTYPPQLPKFNFGHGHPPMPTSICDTYPGICEKSRLRYPRPPRLLRPANNNVPNSIRPRCHTPQVPKVSLQSEGISVIETASAISMLGLVILATYIEMAAMTGILARALDGFF